MNKYKVVIFDLDGTLLYTLEDLWLATNHALETFGKPKRSIDEVRQFVGNGIRNLIIRAVPQGESDPDFEKIFEEFRAYYNVHCEDNTDLYQGIDKLLDDINGCGIKTAVVSNKNDFAVKKLCRKFFGDSIQIAIGVSEKNKKKPAPDTVYSVLEALKMNKDEAIYVGDSEVDIATAKNAGIPCITVTWGFREKAMLIENGANMIADTPEEVKKYL